MYPESKCMSYFQLLCCKTCNHPHHTTLRFDMRQPEVVRYWNNNSNGKGRKLDKWCMRAHDDLLFKIHTMVMPRCPEPTNAKEM